MGRCSSNNNENQYPNHSHTHIHATTDSMGEASELGRAESGETHTHPHGGMGGKHRRDTQETQHVQPSMPPVRMKRCDLDSRKNDVGAEEDVGKELVGRTTVGATWLTRDDGHGMMDTE